MAYVVPCLCGAEMQLSEEPKRCCVPCGIQPEKICPKKEEKFLGSILESLEIDRKMALRQKLENRAEIKKIDSIARFKTGINMEERKMDLESRSERLKRIMEDEMFTYTQELKGEFDKQQESKIDQMRTRVKFLKDKRLEEERKFVEKKLDQAFQNQCEQMRTLLSKRMEKEISRDWEEQIKIKQRLACEEEENDKMYGYLMQVDAVNKWKREQAYECIKTEARKKELEELDRQIQFKKETAANIEKVHARELAINAKIQEELEQEQKKREEEAKAAFIKSKEHVKESLATREYYRDKRLKREEIVAQEFLKKAVRELYIEEEDRNKAKRELMRSIKIYLDYLKKQDAFTKSREVELQRIIDSVIEEQYIKVSESRRREQAQRKRLQCNVMAGRGEQVQDLQRSKAKEEMERQKELEFLKADWKQYLQELEFEKQVKEKKQEEYRKDVYSQMQYQETLKKRNVKESEREAELCELEEGFFQNRLNTTMRQARLEQSNPYRECLTGKKVKQCLWPV